LKAFALKSVGLFIQVVDGEWGRAPTPDDVSVWPSIEAVVIAAEALEASSPGCSFEVVEVEV
jgi:hypothetical protein